MIPQTKIAESTIVFQHIVPELLHLGFVLEVEIRFNEPLVQLDHLSQCEMLPWSLIQTTCGLDQLPTAENVDQRPTTTSS